MSVERFSNPVALDELGIKLGLYRSDTEELSSYRKRVAGHLAKLPESTQRYFISSIGVNISKAPETIFTISPVKTYDASTKTAKTELPNPKVVIDSSSIKVWADFEAISKPMLDIDIWNKDGAYFLKDVYELLSDLDGFEISVSEKDGWQYKKSSHLMCSSSFLISNDITIPPYRMYNTGLRDISKVLFSNTYVYRTEKPTFSEMNSDGDYYIDYANGIIFSYLPGVSTCKIYYNSYPFEIKWHEVSVKFINDESIDSIFKDYLLNENGELERLSLNSTGANIVNNVLAKHPLQWGK